MNKDRLGIYYSMLNIAPGASAKEIKLAYRKLAFEYHPDRNTDLDAEEKFKDITEAYEILIGERKPPAQPSGNNTSRPNDGTKGKTAASEKPTASGYGPNAAGAQNANRTRQGFAGTGRKQEKAKTGTDEKPPAPIRPIANSRPKPARAKATSIPAPGAITAKKPIATPRVLSPVRQPVWFRPSQGRSNSRSSAAS